MHHEGIVFPKKGFFSPFSDGCIFIFLEANMTHRKNNILKLTYTALCAAICVALMPISHVIPEFGSIFSPLHLPVLFCGILCGWHYGLACGIIGPLLASIITGRPPMAVLPPMLVECAVYGLVAGLMIFLVRTKSRAANVYISLVSAMIAGRLVAGAAKALFFSPGEMTFGIFFTSYFVQTLPGAIIQLVLIPTLIFALTKAKLVPDRPRLYVK